MKSPIDDPRVYCHVHSFLSKFQEFLYEKKSLKIRSIGLLTAIWDMNSPSGQAKSRGPSNSLSKAIDKAKRLATKRTNDVLDKAMIDWSEGEGDTEL